MSMALNSSTPSAQRVVGNHERKENATFRGQRLAAVPGDVLTMRNLVVLDLSKNQLTRFPGAHVAADMPRLEVLLLQENVLYVLEDILALSTSPRLRELNLLQNPLRLVENRVYLLEALLSATTCDEKLLRMVQKDEALKTHSTPVETSQAMLQTASSARKMHHRSDRCRHQPQNATMQYLSRLPRRSGFPMLQKLNTDWITDADIHAVEQERGRPIEYFERRAANNNRGDLLHRTTTVNHRFDGSRMTAKELLRRQTRPLAIPEVAVIERFQIDVESSAVVDLNEDDEELVNNKNATDSEDNAATGMTSVEATAARLRDEEEHLEVIHRLFQKSTMTNQKLRRISSTTLLASSSKRVYDEADDHSPTDEKTLHDEHVDPWNHPIQTFDDLSSEDRQYIRHRSRQSVESNLQRDDQFFDSTIFLDCIAQTERSRRLVVQAVDTICPPSASFKNLALYRSFTDSAPTLPPASTAAQQLRETMASKFNAGVDRHEFDKIERFRDKARASGFDERDVQAALSEYFESEHRLQQQRTRQLLSTTCEEPPRHSKAQVVSLESAACAMDESLSRTKLRNAVDLANVLLNKKQEKHMIQMLIDADAKVIEEERAALDQALHRHHLELIASNQFFSQSQHETDREWMRRAARTHATPSPWQERNWRAKDTQRKQQAQQRQECVESSTCRAIRSKRRTLARPASATVLSSNPVINKTEATTTTSNERASSTKFRSIETVDDAMRDALPQVNSHDLLVRCAEIRQHSESHVQGLKEYRDRFREGEAAWETMRHDPINIVRGHLRRQLSQDAQEIQIGSTQLYYSSLFQ